MEYLKRLYMIILGAPVEVNKTQGKILPRQWRHNIATECCKSIPIRFPRPKSPPSWLNKSSFWWYWSLLCLVCPSLHFVLISKYAFRDNYCGFQQLFDPLLLDPLIPLSPTTFVRIPTPQPSISLSIFCFRSVSGFLWLCDKWWGILKTSSHHHCWGDFRKIRRRWLDICPLSPLSTASHIPLGSTKLENHFEGGGNVVKWEKTWSWRSEDAQRCNCGVSVLKWGVSPATVWGSEWCGVDIINRAPTRWGHGQALTRAMYRTLAPWLLLSCTCACYGSSGACALPC